MNSPVGERFPKESRLRKRQEYLDIQHRGVRVQSAGFTGLVRIRKTGPKRLGITASKKLGNAVVRNRTKRLIREAYRRGKIRLPDCIDLVIVAKKAAAHMDTEAVFHDLTLLGQRVMRRMEQPG